MTVATFAVTMTFRRSRLGIAIRDWMMPKFLKGAADDTRNDWLYNHAIAWDEPVAARRP
jgi:hypothetical protein